MEQIQRLSEQQTKNELEEFKTEQERIEKDMNLQGAVAIQDDLAHDVYYSIKRLQAAGIRFWILTGDKADTAEAIAVIIQ